MSRCEPVIALAGGRELDGHEFVLGHWVSGDQDQTAVVRGDKSGVTAGSCASVCCAVFPGEIRRICGCRLSLRVSLWMGLVQPRRRRTSQERDHGDTAGHLGGSRPLLIPRGL